MAAGGTYTSKETQLLVRAVREKDPAGSGPQAGQEVLGSHSPGGTCLSEQCGLCWDLALDSHACAVTRSGLLCCPLVSNAMSLA